MGRGLSELQNGLLAEANAAGCTGITTHDMVEVAVAAICAGSQPCDDQRRAIITASVSRALKRLVERTELIVIRRSAGSTYYSVQFLTANRMPLTYSSFEQPLTVRQDASPTEGQSTDPATATTLEGWVESFVRVWREGSENALRAFQASPK
jgi:hypothetical protein